VVGAERGRGVLASLGESRAGFSLIEVIIVVALIAFVYTVAIPQFNIKSGTEVATKLNGLLSDFRSASDMAILSGQTYRLVFNLNSGDYELQVADRSDVYLGEDKVDRDPAEAEDKDAQAAFDQKFAEYIDLAGQAVADPKADKEIPPTSPVVSAKTRLKPVVWTPVENLEWSKRTIGPHLMFKDIWADHHGRKQELADLGPDGRAMIYIFPNGVIEKAVLHISYKKDEMTPDDSQEPYTVTTNPYEGTADSQTGYVDVDVHEDTADQ
jgi:prepilin-type N-terminal cleavage/methylation domain-containing protein